MTILFISCSTQNVKKRNYIYQFEIDIAFFGADNQMQKRWFITETELFCFENHKMIFKQKMSETSDITQTLIAIDSLKPMNNYGCRGAIPIHGENSVQIVGSFLKNDIEKHFNFKIYNCYLDQKISTLINQLNEKITSSNKHEIKEVQLLNGGCECENFEFVKIYK